jgi:uracil phosphoribosyltransferase
MNPRFPNVWIYDHPLIQHKLTIMRDNRAEHEQFRQLLNQITGLMAYDVCRNLPVRDLDVETPITRTSGSELASTTTIVPILRAGLAMMDGLLALFPEARVGHIGIYRDEKTAQPVTYYAKLPPDIAEGPAIIVDPMLATGGSAVHAVEILKERGVKEDLIRPAPGSGGMARSHSSVEKAAWVMNKKK